MTDAPKPQRRQFVIGQPVFGDAALRPTTMAPASPEGSRPGRGIRAGKVTDVDRLVELCREYHPHTAYAAVPLEEAWLRWHLSAALTDANQQLFVYEADGVVEGFILGYVQPHFFSSALGGYETIFLVSPNRRGSLAAHRLWRQFCRWARDKGARAIWVNISSGVMPERTSRFYRGMGLAAVGAAFTASIEDAVAGAEDLRWIKRGDGK